MLGEGQLRVASARAASGRMQSSMRLPSTLLSPRCTRQASQVHMAALLSSGVLLVRDALRNRRATQPAAVCMHGCERFCSKLTQSPGE